MHSFSALIDMSEGLAERLKAIRDFLGETQKSVSTRFGLGINTWQGYELRGQLPKTETLTDIAQLGFSIDWLVSGRGTMMLGDVTTLPADPQISGRIGSDYALVPRYDVRASAGAGALIFAEQVQDYLAFKASWIKERLRCRPSDLVLLGIVGDSMYPTIPEDHIILVNRAARYLNDGSIYTFLKGDELLVKRVERRLAGGILIKSDNPRYTPEQLTDEEASMIDVIGMVVWHGGVL